MYSMKEVCEKVGMTYETLKFYCNKGLIPNVSVTSSTPTISTDF